MDEIQIYKGEAVLLTEINTHMSALTTVFVNEVLSVLAPHVSNIEETVTEYPIKGVKYKDLPFHLQRWVGITGIVHILPATETMSYDVGMTRYDTGGSGLNLYHYNCPTKRHRQIGPGKGIDYHGWLVIGGAG